MFLGAYWGDRPEGVDDCARRLVSCLTGLASIHGALGRWYPRGKAKAGAVEADPAGLRSLLLAGRNRRDMGNDVIEDLGFSVSLWNRDKSMPSVLSAHCGSYARTEGIVNTCVLDLPPIESDDDPVMELLEPGRASAMMRAVVEAWSPDWAALTPDTFQVAQSPPPRAPYLGWMTYLASGRTLPAQIEGAEVEHLCAGNLLTIGTDPLAPELRDIVVDLNRKLPHGTLDPFPIA